MRVKDDVIIKNQIRNYLIDNFLFYSNNKKINDDDLLIEKGILTSVTMLDLLEYLEENFSIKIEDNEVTEDNLGSIEKISKYILNKNYAVNVSK